MIRREINEKGYNAFLGLDGKDQNRLTKMCKQDSLLVHVIRSGAGLVECLELLHDRHADNMARIQELERLVPFKIKDQDGNVRVWRCPFDLVPER